MLHLAACAAALVVAAMSAHGWGELLRRRAGLAQQSAPVTVALGVAAILALGGFASLARLAFAPTLWGIAAAGVLAWARHRPWRTRAAFDAGIALAAVLIALLVAFAVQTQLPPSLFNHHDDLEKYLTHPVRMLATGTLSGSPLSALGTETLGGAAWLQGFVLSLFPLGYVNGVDAVFGFGLLLALGAIACPPGSAAAPAALLAPVLVAAIEPQYVNVSPLFLGAALMAAAVHLATEAPDARPAPLALGLLYAGLVALKPTLLLFAALHLPLTVVASAGAGQARVAVAWALRVSAWSAVALLPWLALHAPHYFGERVVEAAIAADGREPPLSDLWSFETLRYGASMGHYALLAAVGLALAATRSRALVVAGLTAALSWIVILPLLGPLNSDPTTNLRFAIPFLLGIVPVALARALAIPGFRVPAAGAMLLLTLAFAPAALDRYQQALRDGTILAYLRDGVPPQMRDYVRSALSADAAKGIRMLQAQVPAGEPLLAWSGYNSLLDFARNPIVDAEPAGLGNPWARVPPGIRYVLWQHAGGPVRNDPFLDDWAHEAGWRERHIAARTRAFVQRLRAERSSADVLFDDGELALYRLPAS